jgi:hypothetical protein
MPSAKQRPKTAWSASSVSFSIRAANSSLLGRNSSTATSATGTGAIATWRRLACASEPHVAPKPRRFLAGMTALRGARRG